MTYLEPIQDETQFYEVSRILGMLSEKFSNTFQESTIRNQGSVEIFYRYAVERE